MRIHRAECNRIRKQATLEAFNLLQTQVLDELNSQKPGEFIKIAANRRKSEFKPQYDHCRTLIARIEHFAVGVHEEIYDFDTVNKLAAEHLVFLYPKLVPIINAARESSTRGSAYVEFETLTQRLILTHPELGKRLPKAED